MAGRTRRWSSVRIVIVTCLTLVSAPCAPPRVHAAAPKTIGALGFAGRAGLEAIPVIGFAWAARNTFTTGGGGPPVQEIALTAHAIRETVTTPGGTVSTCYDIAASADCE